MRCIRFIFDHFKVKVAIGDWARFNGPGKGNSTHTIWVENDPPGEALYAQLIDNLPAQQEFERIINEAYVMGLSAGSQY